MKEELKKYRNCPKCGKPMREHDINGHFKGAEDRFLQEIELNRTNSKDEFNTWLLNEKRELNKKIHQMHLDCESEAITINQNGLVLLSVWYNYADIIDNELAKLAGREKQAITSLSEACKGPDEYNKLIEWFKANDLIDSNTLFWKDRNTGSKKALASYLKDLEILNYSRHLSNDDIRAIAGKSFGFSIGMDCIKHAKPGGNMLKKIPPFANK